MKCSSPLLVAGALLALAGLSSCDVDVVEKGEMPKVNVEGGKLPEVDVDVAEIKTGLKEVEVEVPKVQLEKETIKVPVVGIEPPKDDDKENPRTTTEEGN